MAATSPILLPELPEDRATGRTAEIYAEIRVFSGVAYVSSLQRFLATIPGVLDWAWTALRPAMASGAIPESGWRLARETRLSPAPRVPPETLRRWGVDGEALTAIRNIAANFVRVSPVNLVMGACLRCLLTGTAPTASGPTASGPTARGPTASGPTGRRATDGGPTDDGPAPRWTPPGPLPPMPGNADPAALPEDERTTLMRFATDMDGTPFIPALYRQLAHWPPVLAWLADELGPRFSAPETATMRATLQTAAGTIAPAIVAALPALPSHPPPGAETPQRILAAIARYAETSPEMIAFGQLILGALPSTLPSPGEA